MSPLRFSNTSKMKTGLFLLCGLALAFGVQGQEPNCVAPDGGVGICKPIQQCANLLQQVQRYDTVNGDEQQKIRTELRALQCGFDENSYPKVCCSECVNPDGKSGLIKHFRNCTHIFQLFRNPTDADRKFILNSRTSPTSYDVCCGPPREQATSATPYHARCNSLFGSPPEPATRCCGIDEFIGIKIVGGKTADIYEYPWMVLLAYERKRKLGLNCGGSLITNRHVITAAHCVTGTGVRPPVRARIGEFDTRNNGRDCVVLSDETKKCTDGAFSVPIKSIKAHPEYNTSGQQNDIAIVTLEDPVEFTEFVRPICLPTAEPSHSENFKVAGWGRVNETHNRSHLKQVVTLNSYNGENCRRKYEEKYQRSIRDRQICAGGDPDKDSCTGDSGGPLMSEISSPVTHYELAGIVSFGPMPCGTPGWPGVYTNVYKYLDWIRDNIK